MSSATTMCPMWLRPTHRLHCLLAGTLPVVQALRYYWPDVDRWLTAYCFRVIQPMEMCEPWNYLITAPIWLG